MDLAPFQQRLRSEGRLTLQIRVIPRSPATTWAGLMADGSVKLKIAAVPEKGKANEELTRFLAREFAVPRSNVEILAGASSHAKLVRIIACAPTLQSPSASEGPPPAPTPPDGTATCSSTTAPRPP